MTKKSAPKSAAKKPAAKTTTKPAKKAAAKKKTETPAFGQTLPELATHVQLLEGEKIHAVTDYNTIDGVTHERHVVSVSGFSIPSPSKAASKRYAEQVRQALEPILKRHVKRLRRTMKGL